MFVLAFRAGRRFKLRIRLNGSDLMCQMVEKGIGLAILPETAARRCQESMAIRVIPLTDTWALRHLTICVRSFRSLPVHAQRLAREKVPSSRFDLSMTGMCRRTRLPPRDGKPWTRLPGIGVLTWHTGCGQQS
jgi:DNA-binding transcriptional LysR family regulator